MATTNQPTSHSYFVVMVDYGRDTRKVHGLEANVSPEMTFSGAVDKVREAIGDGHEIAFAHEITYRVGGSSHVSDVKDELINRANDHRVYDAPPFDHEAARADHARSLRREA
ncbi:hypothetical protein [Bradyrhizobium sp. 930_D9_N1_4]|uniref:hypothetical protein n=1 Tax=Bradyrhizobium sp. 930_D9_N1_4 TaxID=3240374 RepID=UPI003F8926E7